MARWSTGLRARRGTIIRGTVHVVWHSFRNRSIRIVLWTRNENESFAVGLCGIVAATSHFASSEDWV